MSAIGITVCFALLAGIVGLTLLRCRKCTSPQSDLLCETYENL